MFFTLVVLYRYRHISLKSFKNKDNNNRLWECNHLLLLFWKFHINYKAVLTQGMDIVVSKMAERLGAVHHGTDSQTGVQLPSGMCRERQVSNKPIFIFIRETPTPYT